MIIFEDLDKVDLQRGEDIFYIHSAQLTQLNCHCIFTFPIALQYNIRYKTIANNYTEPFTLPMIKVKRRDDSPYDEGRDLLKAIIAKRMDLGLFVDDTIIYLFVDACGGCLWDLFRLIKDAADNALDFDREKITEVDFRKASLLLKGDYEKTIAENKEKGITVDKYYEALTKCATDKIRKPESSEILLDLRNNLTVLGYNDENWCDVHPLVREILIEKQLIKSKK